MNNNSELVERVAAYIISNPKCLSGGQRPNRENGGDWPKAAYEMAAWVAMDPEQHRKGLLAPVVAEFFGPGRAARRDPRALMRAANVPEPLAEAALSREPPAPVAAYLEELGSTHPRWAWLHGAGLSHIIAGASCAGAVPGSMFVEVPTWTAGVDARDRWGGADGAAAFAQPLLAPPVLVLADLDRCELSLAALDNLARVLRHRRTHRLPTVLTASVPPDGFWPKAARGAKLESQRSLLADVQEDVTCAMGASDEERFGHVIAA